MDCCMKVAFLFVVFVIVGTAGENVTFSDCGSVGGKINYVNIVPCPTQPCTLARGDNYTVNISFTALEDSTNATTMVYGIISGVPVRWPAVPTNACQSNLKCPVTKGATQSYHVILHVEKAYPALRLAVKWELLDDKKKFIYCFVVPVVIT